jgi:hypothetical protein
MLLSELDQIGKREALADYITNIMAADFPAMSMIPKGKRPNQGLVQFQVERYKDKGFRGVPEGKDADNFDSTPRTMLYGRRMRLWDNPGISSESDENVIAGESAGEMARQKRNSLVQVKMMGERAICSSLDSNACTAQIGAQMRGLFAWQQASNWSDLPTDNTAALMPAASRYDGTLDAATETLISDLFISIYKARRTRSKLDALLGIQLKKAFSLFAGYTDTVSNKTATRHLNLDQSERELITVVDRLVTDAADVDLHASSYLLGDPDTGLATAGTHISGLILDMEMLELAYTRLPRIRDLEDRGGGPRAICEMMVTLVNKNPQGHGAIVCTGKTVANDTLPVFTAKAPTAKAAA